MPRVRLPGSPVPPVPPSSPSVAALRSSWGLFLGVFALYAATASRAIQGGDSGELVTVAVQGGVAHPPGYPLFLAVARILVAPLPVEDSAFGVALLSAALGAACAAVLHRAVLRATGDGVAAAVGGLAWALSTLAWRWSVVPEVLSGAALTAALVLLAAQRIAQGGEGRGPAFWLGLAAATGVAHHHTVVLLLPLLAWGAVAAAPRPRTVRGILGTASVALGAACLGFLPYALLLRPGGDWRWGETEGNLAALVHHFLRSDYGSLEPGPNGQSAPRWTQPLLYLREAPRQLPGLLLLLVPIGVVAGFRRVRHGFAVAAVLAWIVAGPLFLSRFALPDVGYPRVVVERFHPIPHVLLAWYVGLGAARVLALSAWSRRSLPVALLVVHLAVQGALSWPHTNQRGATVAADFIENTLASAPPRAIVITSGDSFLFACLHAQRVLGLRPDIACVGPKLLPYPWYRRRILALHPDLVVLDDGKASGLVPFVENNLSTRPVLLSARLLVLRPALSARLPPLIPDGTLLRVLAPGETPPDPRSVLARQLRIFGGYSFHSRLTDAAQLDEELESTLWEHYAWVWIFLADALVAGSDRAEGADAYARARAFSPWLPAGDAATSSTEALP